MCRVRVCLSIVLLFGVSERVPEGVARAADLIEIQARQTETDQDDFVTWTAAPCRIRIKPGTTIASDLAVVLTNDPTQPVPAGRTVPLDGDLVFAATVAPGETATADSLKLTLPRDGSWVNFFIAGKPGRPSERLKDAVIQAHRDSATGEVVGSLGVMVRIRKWAATLTVFEREELLAAMAALKASPQYDTFLKMHFLAVANVDSGGADQAHKSAGFLAWHRAFLVQFERALQATNPGVSLHYWKQEVPSVPAAGDPPDQIAVFSRHFLGVNGTDADGSVIFSRDNDLWGWEITGQALIRANFDRSSPSDYINNFEKDLVQLAQYRDLANPASSNSFSFQLESNPHNDGHGWVGGWMTSCRTSPQDPIFWMFHCDIDRLWARWQFTQGRFDSTGSDPASYMPNDNYALGSTVPLGHHLLDTMWPWNQITGAVVPDDPFADRPPQAPGSPLPASTIPGFWPPAPAKPRPADMIDYLGVNKGGIDLGFSYDDSAFGMAPGAAPPVDLAAAEKHVADFANRSIPIARRLAAAHALQPLPLDAAHLDRIENVVKNPDEHTSVRDRALGTLASTAPKRALNVSIDMAAGAIRAEPKFRVRAIRQLGTLGMFTAEGRSRQADIVRSLHSALAEGIAADVQSEALHWLAAFQDSTTIDKLRDRLAARATSAAKKIEALRLLAMAKAGGSAGAVRPLLGDPDPAVRIAALQSLGNDSMSLDQRRAIMMDHSQPVKVRAAAIKSLMSYDEKFPDGALAIIGNNDEDAELRADAAAGIREYGRRHVKMLGEAGIQGLIGKLNAASAAGPDDLRRTVERVDKKLLEFAKASQSTSREVTP